MRKIMLKTMHNFMHNEHVDVQNKIADLEEEMDKLFLEGKCTYTISCIETQIKNLKRDKEVLQQTIFYIGRELHD